ncbi:unnamed protein product [Oikopleura dioica]|uniref:Sulfotransferase n=1 Tax=Oikopleura dioica TaxID=34765 RepID=E4XYL7_OIKDI|nr:unnamed protein product [Oikopleura dioica]
MPNLIAVGFAKCGTGSLSFLDCHSQIVFRFVESYFFMNARKLKNDKLNVKNALSLYNLPKARKSEVLLEKTPAYMNGKATNLKDRFQLMEEFSPGVKILVLLCDPLHRLWSHMKMNRKESHFLEMANLTENWLPEMKNFNYKSAENIIDLPIFKNGEKVNRFIPFGYAKKVLLMGFYYSRLKILIETFGRDRVLLLDGDNLISDPDTEFGLVEEFVGVRKELSFEFATRYPYPCLDEPVPMCLPDTKGTTHGTTKQPNSTELFNFYKKEMQMLKSFLKSFPNYKNDLKRFLWLDKYDD